jgi:hypothetical protein
MLQDFYEIRLANEAYQIGASSAAVSQLTESLTHCQSCLADKVRFVTSLAVNQTIPDSGRRLQHQRQKVTARERKPAKLLRPQTVKMKLHNLR